MIGSVWFAVSRWDHKQLSHNYYSHTTTGFILRHSLVSKLMKFLDSGNYLFTGFWYQLFHILYSEGFMDFPNYNSRLELLIQISHACEIKRHRSTGSSQQVQSWFEALERKFLRILPTFQESNTIVKFMPWKLNKIDVVDHLVLTCK